MRFVSERRSGRSIGSGSRLAAPWRTRCGLRASGMLCGPTRWSGGSGCSATWRSTWRPAAPTTAPIPELFRSGFVAGAPPDAFSDDGQLWGNPVYDWPALRRRRYRWWVERLRRTLSLFDLARIDHFRGFVAYWAVPSGAGRRSAGRWKRGTRAGAVLGFGGSARDAFAGRRGPGSDHAGGHRASRVARPSRDGRAPVRLRPGRRGEPARVREPRRGSGRVHGDARPRHGCVGGTRGLSGDLRSFVDASFARYGVVESPAVVEL